MKRYRDPTTGRSFSHEWSPSSRRKSQRVYDCRDCGQSLVGNERISGQHVCDNCANENEKGAIEHEKI